MTMLSGAGGECLGRRTLQVALWMGLLLALPAAADRVLDRVVAVVNGRGLTLSDLQFEAAVALVQRGAEVAAAEALDDEALRSALDLALAQRVASDQADKFQAFPVEDSELQSALESFVARFPSPEAYQRFLADFERDETQLAVVLGRALRAEKVLDSRVRLRSQVRDADVKQYLEEHPEPAALPGGRERSRTAVRDQLARERYLQLAGKEIQQMVHGPDVRRVWTPGSTP